MSDGKKSLVLYHDIRQPLEQLTDEQRGKLFMALLDYSEHGTDPGFSDPALSMAFSFIRTAIDRDTKKWEAIRKKRADAGGKGGKKTQENKANQANACFAEQDEQNEANQAVNVNVNATVPVSVPGIIEDVTALTRTDFSPPSVEDVSAYCKEIGSNVPPERFVTYYEARGWKAGNTEIADWKAVLRSWEANGKDGRHLDGYAGSDRGASNSSADGWEPIYDA